LNDLKGPALIDGVLRLIDKYKPLHVSLIGGEPLVRFRELNDLLPRMSNRGIHTQIVTSAVRPIPSEWASIPLLQICVSIDGLQPEHDERRKPATYDRILQNIRGQHIVVHCTITRQQVQRDGYLEEFVRFWSQQQTTKRIWMSLYTPQNGEVSPERLTPENRSRVVAELSRLSRKYAKLKMQDRLIQSYANPPQSPQKCIFAKITTCVSANLEKVITPCQFGGDPDCSNCGCMASAGFAAIGRYKLPLGISVGTLFDASFAVGDAVDQFRERPRRHGA
jgi:sulfatase maturation enzyme AslB (radical SAM superfamily)